jgi:hypothetical protein
VSEQQLQASKQQITNQVKDYYSNSLNSSSDLKTSACCPTEAPPSYLTPLLDNIHPQIKGSFYGCGSPLLPSLQDVDYVEDLGPMLKQMPAEPNDGQLALISWFNDLPDQTP